jgi:hypothetical protein
MNEQEQQSEATTSKVVAGAWVLGALIVAGIIRALFLGPPSDEWKLGGNVHFTSGSVVIYFLLLAALAGACIAVFLGRIRRSGATEGLTLKDGHPHQGITMHQLRVGGNAGGFIFAVGIVLISLLGIPTMWFFVGLAIIAGLAIALLLRGRKAVKIVTIASPGNRPH